MVLDKTRGRADPLLTAIAKQFASVNPNLLTWGALLFSVIAGVFFYLSNPVVELQNFFLFFASFFVFLNGLFDAIDGKVAKLTNKASVRGDFLDHALDRYADVFMVGALALSAWCRSPIGLLAVIGVLLTSYMGTQAQAIGYKRDYSGLLGRADRLVLLIIFPILQHILLRFPYQLPWNLTIIELVLVYFAIVGNITAIQRFYLTLRWFKNDMKKEKN
ncbi:MAG: CDP-alcohol phosphatidyltransferase family protein [Candidatus Thermoplasmatota archaeon]|nr:CDP-alcohol phosphatidyltransferase family protein [Candidatus Thermoplasmatota archaeon]